MWYNDCGDNMKTIVIGAGASGLMAGKNVTIIRMGMCPVKEIK